MFRNLSEAMRTPPFVPDAPAMGVWPPLRMANGVPDRSMIFKPPATSSGVVGVKIHEGDKTEARSQYSACY